MSISTLSMNAGSGLPNTPKATTLTAGSSAPSTGVKAQAEMAKTPAVQVTADVKGGVAAKSSDEQVRQSLQEINKALNSLSISVQFQIDPDYKEAIIKVVDQENGKVIRQIPTEDVVRIAKAMDNLKGLLFAQAV